MRFLYSVLLLLPLCQTALAAELVVFGQQTLFFAETQVAIRFVCPDKPQVNWSLESANRKLMSGVATVRDSLGVVEFRTPPLKDGVTFSLKLTIDGKTEPFILVSRDVFADQKEWLEGLNILLIEDGDNKVAMVFESAGIPFKTNVDDPPDNALIVVAGGEISENYRDNLLWEMIANNVLFIAPETVDFALPQLATITSNNGFTITNQEASLFKNKKSIPDDNIAQDAFRDMKESYSNMATRWLLLGIKDDKVALQTIGQNTSGTGWRYAEFQFGSSRQLFIMTGIFDHWETSPAARLFLKMLFEELEIKETK